MNTGRQMYRLVGGGECNELKQRSKHTCGHASSCMCTRGMKDVVFQEEGGVLLDPIYINGALTLLFFL